MHTCFKSLVITAMFIAGCLALSVPEARAQADCPWNIYAYVYQGWASGNQGATFDVTALQSTKICRIWPSLCYFGASTVEIYYRYGGVVASNTGWTYAGSAYVNPVCNVFVQPTEIPVDLNLLVNAGETVGFAIWNTGQVIWGCNAQPSIYQDSYLYVNTDGYYLYGSTSGGVPAWGFSSGQKWFGMIYYTEGCYIPDGTVTLTVTDEAGQPIVYTNPGATLHANYSVTFPAGAATANYKLDFFLIGGSKTVPVYTKTFSVNKPAGLPVSGFEPVVLPADLPPGYYRVEMSVNSISSCGTPFDKSLGLMSLMVLAPGQTPCIVWPGDLNNDGMVNYADRNYLNRYIFNANLRPTWLQGPGRYRADEATNPLTYYTWEGQVAVPWSTPDGCYVDADGNGTINNYDYLPIKTNWYRTHEGGTPKQADLPPESFALMQNYPNPFRQTTSIRVNLPEPCAVTLTVTDVLGRVVQTLADGPFVRGAHTFMFDGSSLESGSYQATVMMTGSETGMTFSQSIRMTISR